VSGRGGFFSAAAARDINLKDLKVEE